MMDYYDGSHNTTECIINGVRRPYDACSSGTLNHALKFYRDNFEYIGSGTGEIYFNGVRNFFTGTHHYFIYSNKKQIRKKKLEQIEKSK